LRENQVPVIAQSPYPEGTTPPNLQERTPMSKPSPLAIHRLNRDPRIRELIKTLSSDPDAYLGDLQPHELTAVLAAAKEARGEEVDLTELERALNATEPIYRVEAVGDGIDRLRAAWSEPIMRALWRDWQAKRGRRGPAGKDGYAKAVMAMQAMTGMSANLDDAHSALVRMSDALSLFQDLDRSAGRSWPGAASYQGALRRASRLGASCYELGLAANIAMIKEAARLHPKAGIGERLFIDGKLHAAWCLQLSAGAGKDKRADLDAHLRRNTPHAGARAVAKDGAPVKFARGYYLVALCEQATGLPLVWVLQDASDDEAPALIPLLRHLYDLWPDCPTKLIAADSAWDEDWAVKHCAVNYGIDLIARLHAKRAASRHLPPGRKGRGALAIDPAGRVICKHGPLPLAGIDRPRRDGLAPGEPTPEREHRVRGLCDGHGSGGSCGRCSVAMAEDWSLLTAYPHYREGQPARHAMREAMLTRRNAVEALFNRLEAGYKQTGEGGDRVRVRDFDTHRALITLSFLSMTALGLGTLKRRAGVSPGRPKVRDLASAMRAPRGLAA
jgi:hypothetical protein